MIPSETALAIEMCGHCPFSGVRARLKSSDPGEEQYAGTGCFITAYDPFWEAEFSPDWPTDEYPRLFRSSDFQGNMNMKRYPCPPPAWCPLRGRRLVLTVVTTDGQ